MITNFKYFNMVIEDDAERKFTLINDLNFDTFSVNFNKANETTYSTHSYPATSAIKQKQFISELFKNHKNKTNLSSGLLPPAIKYSFPGLVVFERPPTYQMVQYIPTVVWEITENHDSQMYRLPIPWQLYIINYDPTNFYCTSVKMLFTQNSLNSVNQKVFMPPLPNFFTNGSLCRPMYGDMQDIERYPKNLSGVISSAHDWIWNSGFNHDLTESVSHVKMQKKPAEIFNNKDVHDFQSSLGFNSRSVNPILLSRILRAWEKIDINDILNVLWPNPSLTQNFEGDPGYYSQHDSSRFDISCSGEECGEENCECYPDLKEESQSFGDVMLASLNTEYSSPLSVNLDKNFSETFKLINS